MLKVASAGADLARRVKPMAGRGSLKQEGTEAKGCLVLNCRLIKCMYN